ncbi:DNA recombination protein RmuC [Nocardioides sp. CER19]|uniref:DNA recombination protein RmuC n=1 Tax=Nocardioides sp. CER19 TaxID=3038538 RepID=UPI00244CB5ED|nr:DNA recombination protein RmuC [Nocardioides sp. CER19]MDH2415623.1 DNA recombination protein RmuC [Nocardioides sp. CER19]
MATLGLVVLGVLLGLLLGGLAARTLLQQRFERLRSAESDAARVALDDAVRRETERAAAAEAHAHAMFTARQDAVVAQLQQQAATDRADVEQRLSAAVAQVAGLQEALEAARLQHRESLEAQRRAQAEREKGEAGQAQVLKTLTPVVEHLRSMQTKVDSLEKARVEQHTELAAQIRHTQRSVEESRKAADTLASVLKNNSVRGAWGETQLRTLVETAGLLNRIDFELQHSVEADSGDRRPDMVINLPGGKQMAIDAKVPYNSFMDAQREGLEPETRQRLLDDHAKKVRGHVDVLARKGYWTGLPVSPEFTVAFIPNEQLLNAALEVDPSLMEHAFRQGIVLATPTNLWSMLKTVAFTWKQEALTEDAQALFEMGQVLYRRIVKLADHVDKLGRSIERSVKDYNAFTGSLERSVLPAARKLNAADPVSVIAPPHEIEEAPRSLTAGDFAALADVERPELDLTLAFDEAVEAEIVDEADAG